ncbi:hypothetical protein G6F48_011121 [Rhizopus delemar]|nr:hypothetical protein G6F48_011121 [Rhizopus delemar]
MVSDNSGYRNIEEDDMKKHKDLQFLIVIPISNVINEFASFGRKKSSSFVFGSAAHTALYPKDSKEYCNFHKTTKHSNDECHAVKKASSCSSSTRVDVSSSSATCQQNSRNLPSGLGRPCCFCGADNWHPNYPCKGKGHSTGSSSNPLFLPCLPVASSDNGTSISAVSSATPTAGSSDVSFGRKTDAAGPAVSVSDSSDDMDIDVAKVLTVIEAAQACKYIIHHIFSKAPSNTIMLYVLIIIEHIKTWAMIDAGSSFRVRLLRSVRHLV